MRARRKSVQRHSNRSTQAGTWTTASLFAIPCFAVLYAGVSVFWRPSVWVLGAYLGLSLITFGLYALDKAAARQGAWRTPEKTLHLLALTGGWPGALLAQQFLRHKSVKPSFRWVFWLTVLANVAAFSLLCSPWAHSFL